jgi:hypothetical protein
MSKYTHGCEKSFRVFSELAWQWIWQYAYRCISSSNRLDGRLMLKKWFDWAPSDIAAWEKLRAKGLGRFVPWYGCAFGGILFILLGDLRFSGGFKRPSVSPPWVWSWPSLPRSAFWAECSTAC